MSYSDDIIARAKVMNQFINSDANSNWVTNNAAYSTPNAVYKAFPREYQGRLNAAGFVSRKRSPNTAYIDPTASNDVIPHEAAHLQQHQAIPLKERRPDQFSHPTTTGAVGMWRDQMRLHQALVDYLGKNTPNAKITELNLRRGGDEALAEVQAQEAMMPAGSHILDKLKLRDRVTKEFARQLDTEMMPDKNKVFNDDFFVSTGNEPGWLAKLQRLIRNYTSR